MAEKVMWYGPFNQHLELNVVGSYRGVTVAAEPHDDDADYLLHLASMYIDAYYDLWGTPPEVINATYADNNLRYLLREYWEESGDLFRIAVPFTATNDTVKSAQFIATFRAMMCFEGEVQEFKELPPSVQRLLSLYENYSG